MMQSFIATGKELTAEEINVMTPDQRPVDRLTSGKIGYLIASVKTFEDACVGDTITSYPCGASEPLPGYQEAKPMLFAGIFSVDLDYFDNLREYLEKLKPKDTALQFEV